jgi:hypothetical protein
VAKEKGKAKKLSANLIGISDLEYEENITIPFDLSDVEKLKIGQEIKVTISGCVTRLEGSDHYSCIGLEVYDKSFRRTSNQQAEGIRELASEDEEY